MALPRGSTKQQQASPQRNIGGSGGQGVKRSRSRSRGGDSGSSSAAEVAIGTKRAAKAPQPTPVARDGASSVYCGVTQHVRTQRFEAHIWESGKQHYLGGWESAAEAALAFDLAGEWANMGARGHTLW